MELTVVVPTYNEAGNIGKFVRELRAALSAIEHEILVVDDNSPDGTAAEAHEAGARVEVRTRERGLATAVVHGFARATGRYVAVMDADFQHPVGTMRRMYERAMRTDADLVVGSRYVEGGSEGGFGALRKGMSRGAAALAKVALPQVRQHRVTDPMSGLFLVRKDAVDLTVLRPQGYKILLEILGRCPLRRVEEVGYVFATRDHGESKLGGTVLLQYLMHLMALGWVAPENQRFARFALVGLSGILVNLGVLWTLHGLLGFHDLIAVLIAVEASVLSNFLLNDRFTFHDRRNGNVLRRLLQFHVVSLLAMAINLGAYSFFSRGLHWHYLVAEAAAIVIAFGGNYLGNLHWTYGHTDRFRFDSRRLLPYVPLAMVVVGAGFLFSYELDDPPEVYFDEHYYLSVARQIDNGVWEDPCWVGQEIDHRPLNFEHPPLAKLIIAWSVAQFDSDHHVFEGCREPDKDPYKQFTDRMRDEGNPYAWRMPSVLLGVAAVAFSGLATARLFRSPAAGALASLFVALDGMTLTSSRLAILDIFAAGFTAAALWAATFPTKRGLLAAGILLGAGFASKFIVVFAGPAVLLVALYCHWRVGRLTRRRFDLTLLLVPVLPLFVWVGSMAPWLRIWYNHGGLGYMVRHFWTITRESVSWGATAQQEHAYSSGPLQWLTLEKPIFYYSQTQSVNGQETLGRYVWAFQNPVFTWAAVAAVVIGVGVFLAQWIRTGRFLQRGTAGAMVVAALVPTSTFLGFFLLSRDMFIFYMTLVVPLMAVPLAGGLLALVRRSSLGLIPLAFVTLAGAAVFAHFYPVHVAHWLPPEVYEAKMDLIPWMHA